MNRKNLTAAVLAGLAGAAGLAGTAQAVNLNPDGLGQVLLYPYYTTNDGNQTVLSVVNTTDQAKAVKVRFLEGYNSREVLDFNLYLSAYDVWVAALADGGAVDPAQEGVPHILIPDTSCTVPYLYEMNQLELDNGTKIGVQEFLPYAYTGKFSDNGPTGIDRAAEGHFEMIEMGVLVDDDTEVTGKNARPGAATAATHVLDKDGNAVPYDCEVLVENWTLYPAGSTKPHPMAGVWRDESGAGGQAYSDTRRNRGGLFGGASVVNSGNGTMFSYDAKAIQGFDKTNDGIHYVPGNANPSLDSGSERTATVFFGTPNNRAVSLTYPRTVDAVSAVFMHDFQMNTFTQEESIAAASEFVFTFPTKAFYVDRAIVGALPPRWIPDVNDVVGCNGWQPGDPYPPGGPNGVLDPIRFDSWITCDYVLQPGSTRVRPPFVEEFNDDGLSCHPYKIRVWDREESPTTSTDPDPVPPIVSPPPPVTPPGQGPRDPAFCYEVNRLAVGAEGNIFGDTDLVSNVSPLPESGWARVNFTYVADLKDGVGLTERYQDFTGLRGLPVTGFVAEEYRNDFVDDGVQAFYGGIYQHKSSVKRDRPNCRLNGTCPRD